MTPNNFFLSSAVEKNHYPPETAGRLMITAIPVILPDYTIKQTEDLLLERIKDFETINYIYIVQKNGQLAGVISIKDILRQPKQISVEQVMTKKIITAHPYTDQEKVADLAFKNNIKAVPIVDKAGIFLGIVPNDVVLKIAYDEAREDILKLSGVSHHHKENDDILQLSLPVLLKHRLPWLLIGLLGGVLTAQTVRLFENTLAENLILAAFIPLIVYMSDAVGTQMESFIIRDLSLNEHLPFIRYFFRQLQIVVIIGLLLSVALLVLSGWLYHNWLVAQVLGIALFSAIFSSVITGLIIPYFFSRLKLDPANASGPVATIIQDFLSIMIYFIIASLFL